ncbi:MAG: V4R domain-containing protein [Myxococcota bacterium]
MARGMRRLTRGLQALGLDLEGLLRQDPRMLLDGEILASLRAELAARLAPEEVRTALLQLGFLHGMRDALALVRTGFAPLEPSALGPAAARLAIRLRPQDTMLHWAGGWPEALEARTVPAGAASPVCHVSAGYTAGWLSGLLDADVAVREERCRAAGDAACEFVAREAEGWAESGIGADDLPFDALRDRAARDLPDPEPPLDADRFEPGAPVIHVWGPVMILPFAGTDECLRSLDLIGREPGARPVRVVVIDLGGAVIDEDFGAASLEQVLDAIVGWGAEPIPRPVSWPGAGRASRSGT